LARIKSNGPEENGSVGRCQRYFIDGRDRETVSVSSGTRADTAK